MREEEQMEANERKYFEIPANFYDLTPEKQKVFINLIWENMRDQFTLQEDESASETGDNAVLIQGASLIGVSMGISSVSASLTFLQERQKKGKLHCHHNWCGQCKSDPKAVSGDLIDHLFKITLPAILELSKEIAFTWQWRWPNGDWALSHGSAEADFKRLVAIKSRPNCLIQVITEKYESPK
jgi:hypothetical protein